MVEQHLQRDRQHRHQRVLRQHDQEQGLQVQPRLEREVAFEQLDQHAAQHCHEQHHRLQADQAERLGHQRQPARHRQRVEHLVEARLAFAPDQFAGVEGGDDQHEQLGDAADHFEYLVGHREGVGAIERAEVERRGEQRQHAGQRDHHEVDVLERLAQVQPGRARQQQRQAAAGEIGLFARVDRRAGEHLGALAFGPVGRAAVDAADEMEAPVTEQQHREREAGPGQAVDQVDPFEADRAACSFRRRSSIR